MFKILVFVIVAHALVLIYVNVNLVTGDKAVLTDVLAKMEYAMMV